MSRDRNYGPAVDPSTRALRYTSASAIAAFNHGEYGGCHTRWWRRYVGGEKEPKGKALDLGLDIHDQLEHYLATTTDALGKIARPGKRFLPVPGPDLGVEVPIDEGKVTVDGIIPGGYTLAGVSIVGSIDLLNMRGSYINSVGELLADPVGTIEVHDHKTTSSMSRAKTPEQLIEVTQMPLYGEYVRRKYAGLSFIRLSHLYLLTDGAPMARKSSILVPVAVVQRRAEQIEQLIVEMGQVARIEKVADVPKCPNAGMKDSACQSFGRGCPFKDRCFSHVNAITRMRMSFIKKTIATGANTPASTPAASAAPAGIPLPPGNIPAPPGASTAAQPGGGAQPPPQTVVGPTGPVTLPDFYACNAIQGQPYVVDGVNTIFICRTDGRFSFGPTGSGAPILKNPGDIVIPGALPAQATTATAAVNAALAEAGASTTTTTKRGRKKAGEAAAGEAVEGIHLYINSMPTTINGLTMLDPYVAERVAEVNKSFGTIDPRVSQSNDDPLAFGKWKAIIGETVRINPPPPGRYLVFTNGNEVAAAVAEALIPLCVAATRGVR
jgi:hypothetical protein